ncbi:mCG1036350 [Mus musculus]|nr:mCG1036350 [Mus musculus]
MLKFLLAHLTKPFPQPLVPFPWLVEPFPTQHLLHIHSTIGEMLRKFCEEVNCSP